jgi:hypothetical protein
MAPETFHLDPIPNADLDTDSDPDAGRSSCADGEGHPFMTVGLSLPVGPQGGSSTASDRFSHPGQENVDVPQDTHQP